MAAAAALPNVFYLDDPQDGASSHLLASIGVAVHRAPKRGVPQPSAPPSGAEPAPASSATEHAHDVAVVYGVDDGAALLDVRDSADAWVRLVLRAGDRVTVAGGVHRRLPAPGTRVVTVPALAADADGRSRMSTVAFRAPAEERITDWGVVRAWPADADAALAPAHLGTSARARFAPGSPEEAAANVPHFARPGTPHTRSVVVDLCEAFYHLGWVTGTGGSISIRHGDRIFMAPSGVQKERMQPQDIFVLDTSGAPVYAPTPLPGKATLKLSQCAPLFQHAFALRRAGACIHTHDVHAVMCTLTAGGGQGATEFAVTHQEMIKGIAGHGFTDKCVVPIIENTSHECDLADSLEEAMVKYPASNAVLVRRHGVYIWGATWEAAKTQAECYHYLFDVANRMRAAGIDPAAVPPRVAGGIGAATSYGTPLEGAGAGAGRDAAGFHGAGGVAALNAAAAGAAAAAPAAVAPVTTDPAALRDVDAVVLDIEGATTSIAFVTQTLFPYAAAHVGRFLDGAWPAADGARPAPEVAADIAGLAAQSAADVAAALPGAADSALGADIAAVAAAGAPTAAARAAAIAAVERNVRFLMASDRKVGPLKALQGRVWRDGYASGELRGHVFEDTPRALDAWAAGGRRVYIYSSGSREAQRLLFAHSVAGDLRPRLAGYFDTAVGPKTAPTSYADIVLSLGVDGPGRVLFVTDAIAEARAAAAAGLKVAVTDRPGNVPLPAGHGFPVVRSLLELTP